MPKKELTKPYEPNPVLEALYRPFLQNLRVDEAWVDRMHELRKGASLVYVMRNLNVVDFLALDQVTRRFKLPRIHYVNDLGLWVLNPLGKGWLNALVPRRGPAPRDELAHALSCDGSAALFIKRPPGVFDVAAGASSGRGVKEGDELVRSLFELQRSQDKPIFLVPLLFVWSHRPDTRGRKALDVLLGPPEWPTSARAATQAMFNYKRVVLRPCDPLSLQEFLEANRDLAEETLARRATYAVLRRLERERRAITGPVSRDPDRLRHDLTRSPRLRALIGDLAGGSAEQQSRLLRKADAMLRELQARPDPLTLRGLETSVAGLFRRIYAGIEHNPEDLERIREASKEGTLVLLPSHKSHVDYLVLSYTFYEENLPLPVIAAGDNLNFFPMGPLFRRAGAFFIRRSFRGDRLYAAVVDAYIRRLMRDGHPIELFLEGGRSRTGKLLAPRFGLLSMIVDAALALPRKPVFFVPISVGYERVIETESYERELTGGEKSKEDAKGLLRSSKVLSHRYGRINLQIGQIVSLADMRQAVGVPEGPLRPAKRRALVTRLGHRVMDEINRVTAVTPGALTALALLTHSRRGLTHEALVDRCMRLLGDLRELDARISTSMVTAQGSLRTEAIREAMQMFVDAELVEGHGVGPRGTGEQRRRSRGATGEGAIYTIADNKRFALDTTKNIIVHFFVDRAIVASSLVASPVGAMAADQLRERAQYLAKLFKYEFRFQSDTTAEAAFDVTVGRLIATGILVRDGAELRIGPGHSGWSGERWLSVYAAILRNFVEGYRMTARSLTSLLAGPLPEKDSVKRTLSLGREMYFAGELERREAVSKPLVTNALLSFVGLGVIHSREQKLELTEAFASEAAIDAFEHRIANYLEEAR